MQYYIIQNWRREIILSFVFFSNFDKSLDEKGTNKGYFSNFDKSLDEKGTNKGSFSNFDKVLMKKEQTKVYDHVETSSHVVKKIMIGAFYLLN